MNVWIQIGALLAFTAAVLFALACCCYAGAKFFSDLGEGYGALFKHAKKVPRFGMGALFLFVSVFAVASAIFRWLAPSGPVGTVFAAVAALVLAAGVVCSVKCVLDDVYANWSRRPGRRASSIRRCRAGKWPPITKNPRNRPGRPFRTAMAQRRTSALHLLNGPQIPRPNEDLLLVHVASLGAPSRGDRSTER